MKVLKIKPGILTILLITLFSCKENKGIQEKENNKLSVEVLSVKKEKSLYNISVLVDNNNDDKYVMLYNYQDFEERETYPRVIEKEKETIIDYNFFFKDRVSYVQDSINNIQDSVTDFPIGNINSSFSLFILPKGKTKVILKDIPISDTTNKKYLYLYFSKMKEEIFRALPKGTKNYDISANEKGFRNYKFSKEIIVF